MRAIWANHIEDSGRLIENRLVVEPDVAFDDTYPIG